MAKPNGAIIWQGLSRYTGAEIGVIVTGLHRDSANPKTGAMPQVWILRSDTKPADAASAGDDDAVCGACPLRRHVCYVSLIHGPRAVWDAWDRGAYPTMAPAAVRRLVGDRPIRFGAYGDPAAVPTRVWRELHGAHTGYTHGWRRRSSLQTLVMASVDSADEQREATAAGWRTFRAKRPDDPMLPGEVVCPASAEAGHRTTCADCRLCDGSTGPDDRRANIVINIH